MHHWGQHEQIEKCQKCGYGVDGTSGVAWWADEKREIVKEMEALWEGWRRENEAVDEMLGRVRNAMDVLGEGEEWIGRRKVEKEWEKRRGLVCDGKEKQNSVEVAIGEQNFGEQTAVPDWDWWGDPENEEIWGWGPAGGESSDW